MSDFRIKPRILVTQKNNYWVALCIDFQVPEVPSDEKDEAIAACIQDIFWRATKADLKFGCMCGSDLIDWCAGGKVRCDVAFKVHCDMDTFDFEGFDIRCCNAS